MDKDYMEFLNKEIEKACKNFEEAKEKAIRELERMTICEAVTYGAGYAIHIDDVSMYAAEVKKLNDLFNAYKHFAKENKND